MKFYALDPGTWMGWAEFTGEINTASGTVHGEEEIYTFLKSLQADAFVVEDYKVRTNPEQGGWSHAWSSVFSAQCIGMIKYRAHELGIPIHLQQSTALTMGSILAFGKKIDIKKQGKNNHAIAAICHGHYFLKHGVK